MGHVNPLQIRLVLWSALAARDEGDGVGGTSRGTDPASEAFLGLKRRLAPIHARLPGIEGALLHTETAGRARIG
jgi:hypothetical protein